MNFQIEHFLSEFHSNFMLRHASPILNSSSFTERTNILFDVVCIYPSPPHVGEDVAEEVVMHNGSGINCIFNPK